MLSCIILDSLIYGINNKLIHRYTFTSSSFLDNFLFALRYPDQYIIDFRIQIFFIGPLLCGCISAVISHVDILSHVRKERKTATDNKARLDCMLSCIVYFCQCMISCTGRKKVIAAEKKQPEPRGYRPDPLKGSG